MGKYSDLHAIDRAMDFASASAQLELRLLRIQPHEARRFRASQPLLFPNPLLAPPPNASKRTARAKSAYGPMDLGRLADV